MHRVGVLVLLAGCDLVFPAHDVPDAAGATELVTGTFFDRQVTTDNQLISTAADVAMAGIPVTVTLPDGSHVDTLVDNNGNFSFERPVGSPYRILLGDPREPQEIQHDAASLRAARVSVGHTGTQPTKPTLIKVAPNTTAVASVGGQWSFTVLAPGQTTLDWRDATPRGNIPVGLLEFTDNLLLLGYENPSGKGFAIAKIANIKTPMVDGITADFSGISLGSVNVNACGHVMAANRPTIANRFHQATPRAKTPVDDYLVLGVPDAAVGPVGGINIIALNEPAATPLDVTTNFHDPFPEHLQLLASFGAFGSVDIAAANATPLAVPVELRVFDSLAEVRAPGGTACASSPTVLDTALGTPIEIAAGGVKLADDEQPVAVADTDLELSWQLDGADADAYAVRVFHVASNGGATEVTQQRLVFTVAPHATLDRAMFVPNESYVVGITSLQGYPGAAGGDLARIAYPFARSTTFSTVFQAN